jgi:glyoxylase-like metal-dependent hydrolase (beta-lactamase superfamily II)
LPAALAYPFAARPEPATMTEVAPGVFWLRMPLPFALNHINLWALEDEGGWTLVDTGLGDEVTRGLWAQLFAPATGPLSGKPVRRLICTHFHPDHAGLAGWLTERFGIELWMTRAEWLFARMLRSDTDATMVDDQVEFYRRAGAPAEYLDGVRRAGPTYARRVAPIPRAYRRLRGGDEVAIGGRVWRVVIGLGHAPEHACLWCAGEKLLIAGDMVLPRISPNVGVWPNEPEANPLAEFLDSLQGIRALPDEALVLPSHNEPFRGLHERIDELGRHHEERLDKLVSLIDAPKTAMEIARGLFTRPLDQHQTGFAIGETLSHLHMLRARGGATRHADPDGIWRYERA